MSDSQYFEESPGVASAPVDVEVRVSDLSFTLRTDRGVFSHGALDAGTRLLIEQSPRLPEGGTFLDLGCGAGPIAIALGLRRRAATVWAVDVNERARDLTRMNAERAGLTNVHVASPDDVPADIHFDIIWSNPPIRIGKQALHTMLIAWLARLAPGGTAILVVHKHLGSDSLATWLESSGWAVHRLTSRAGYRLLAVAQP